MATIQYTIQEQQQALNTGIAAADNETPISATQRVDAYNHLEIINSDNVKIEIRLDSDANRAYFIEAKTGFVLDVSEGQRFTSIQQFNRDAAAAQVAGLIQFKAMKKVAG